MKPYLPVLFNDVRLLDQHVIKHERVLDEKNQYRSEGDENCLCQKNPFAFLGRRIELTKSIGNGGDAGNGTEIGGRGRWQNLMIE